jgi:hypothetical protein
MWIEGFHTGGVVKLALACALSIPAILAVSGSASAASRLEVTTRSCTTSGTSACRIMPAAGTFTLPIPGTGAALTGIGAPDRAGKPIVISRTGLVCSSLGGIGIRIVTPRSTGLLPPLRWSNGTLYYRDRSTGRCVGVASPALAAAPGVYQVVPTTSVTHMPTTGGGSAGRLASPVLPFALGLLMLLLGVFAVRRSTQDCIEEGT